MRVTFVIDFFAPAWGYGGPPRQLDTIANELAMKGHEITVIATDALDSRRYHSGYKPIFRTLRVRNLSNRMAWERRISTPIPATRIISAIRNSDVVHLCTVRSAMGLMAYLGAEIAEKPLVFTPWGSIPCVGSWERLPKRMYDYFVLSMMKKRVCAAIGQNAHEVEQLCQWGVERDKAHLVPLCVNLSEYQSLPEKGLFLKGHPELLGFEQIYIFLGRIHRHKGIDMLLRAFHDAFPSQNCALVIAGRDEESHISQLKIVVDTLKLRDCVFFPGAIYGVEKRQAYVDSHAFVVTPSIYEETSLAALEAAACRTPLVTSVQAETPWLEEYSAGMTTPFDRRSICEALVRMSAIVGRSRTAMGMNARRLVEERFSPKKVAEQHEEIYNQVARS